ncbi:MAG: hypothetical protein HC897_11280 [Thermoanaerobaculia bacterium]|nr:hypothetical protein [Thermoanaerobaculia bacterium]
MLTYLRSQPLFRRSRRLGRCLLAASAFLAIASPFAASPCVSEVELVAGESWRDAGRGTSEQVCFSLWLETPGILTVDLATAAVDPQARLLWLSAMEQDLLWQSPTSLIASVGAGRFELRVAAENPRLALSGFRLSNRFLPTLGKAGRDSEIEIEPMGRAAESHSDQASPTAARLDRSSALCRKETGDDHADDLACATPSRWASTLEVSLSTHGMTTSMCLLFGSRR